MIKLKLLLFLLAVSGFCHAQTTVTTYKRNLDKRVSLDIKQEAISSILDKMSKAGDFYFSYSGTLFKQDSIVTIKMKNTAVREILDQLFNGKVDYKETRDHIILRYAANHLTIEPDNITSAEGLYLISGFVTDTETGKRLKQASVYEKRLLQSTLTDNEGYFRMRFKGDHTEVILTASKESYRDTSLVFLSDITIKPESYKDQHGSDVNTFFNSIENSGFSRFFISSKQKIQSLNIPDFFANSPFQASLTPGLSSHGIMSSQVINKLSLNVLGGYTAGTNGFEIAGLFNITKGDVKKMQAAGLFNVVGGSIEGFQIAGLVNDVRTDLKGMQAAGLVNRVKGNAAGMQVAGLGNVTAKHMKGVQIAGLFNYAKKMDGVQFGLINLSDTSSGYSIGLLNLVKHGYHQVSLSANDVVNTNIGFKTGNAKLYTKVYAGVNVSDTAKVATVGIGLGHDFILNKTLYISTEIAFHYLYLGNWDYGNTLTRLQSNLHMQLFKGFGIFAGPTYYTYNTDIAAGSGVKNYKQQIPPSKHHKFSTGFTGWLGWNVGITLF